jgi:hypothetical protein
VQKLGCAALGNLTHNNDQNRVTIAAKGGIDVILEAMQRHSDHAEVQEQGCTALHNLACKNDQNTATIMAKGGIDVIVYALGQHSDHTGVLKQGNLVLTNLDNSSGNKSKLRGLISAAQEKELFC